MPDLQIHFNGITPAIVIPIGILLLAFGWYYYRTTIPPITNFLRLILRALRMLGILLTVILLVRPVVSVLSHSTKLPVIAVLVDDSQSMRIKDKGVLRSAVVTKVLYRMSAWSIFPQEALLKLYRFAATTDTFAVSEIDSLTFNGGTTNIGNNIATLARDRIKHNIQAMIVVSDGAINSGMFPETAVRGIGLPVYTVGIGDSTPVKDIVLSSVLTNVVAYRNNTIPVKVTISAYGYAGKTITVLIKDNKSVVARTRIKLAAHQQEQDVTLEFVPKTEGIHRYTVAIPVFKGEKLSRNNRAAFSVRVLKDKLKVLMISGVPNYDTQFIKRALDDDPSVMVTLRFAFSRGSFSGGTLPQTDAEMEPFDLVVLQDVPASFLSANTSEAIKRFVLKKGKGLLVLAGEQSCIKEDFTQSPLQEILPLTYVAQQKRSVIQDFQPVLTNDGLHHQVTALYDDPEENVSLWKNIPPFKVLMKPRLLAKGSTVLATHPTYKFTDNSYAPVFVLNRAEAGRVMQVAAFPLWRWRFSVVPVDPTAAKTYNFFMANAIRWLLMADDNKLFSIKPAQRMYRAGEKVLLKAQLYDSQYRPRDGAAIEVVLRHRTFMRRVVLEPSGEAGLYQASITGIPTGSYFLIGSAMIKGKNVGADTSKLYIDDHSLEFDAIQMRSSMLRRTAHAAGGFFVSSDAIDSLKKKIVLHPEDVVKKRHWEPWNSWILLAVIILLFSTEWIIRKRKGML